MKDLLKFLLFFFLLHFIDISCIESNVLLGSNFDVCTNIEITLFFDGELLTDASNQINLIKNESYCFTMNYLNSVSHSNQSITINSGSPSFFSSIATYSVESSGGVVYKIPYLEGLEISSNSSFTLKFVAYVEGSYQIFLNNLFFFNFSITSDAQSNSTNDTLTFQQSFGTREINLDNDVRNNRSNKAWINSSTVSLQMIENLEFPFDQQLSFSPSLLLLQFNNSLLLSLFQRVDLEEGFSFTSPLFLDSIFNSISDDSLKIFAPFLISFQFKNKSQIENSSLPSGLFRMVDILFIPTKINQYTIQATTSSQIQRGLKDTIKVIQFSNQNLLTSNQNVTQTSAKENDVTIFLINHFQIIFFQ